MFNFLICDIKRAKKLFGLKFCGGGWSRRSLHSQNSKNVRSLASIKFSFCFKFKNFIGLLIFDRYISAVKFK